MTNVLTTIDLGKRYRGGWALRHCSLELPPVGRRADWSKWRRQEHIAQSGRGLLQPTEGEVRLRCVPERRSRRARADRVHRSGPAVSRGFTVWRCCASGPRSILVGMATWRDRDWTVFGIPLDREDRKVSRTAGAGRARARIGEAGGIGSLDEPVARSIRWRAGSFSRPHGNGGRSRFNRHAFYPIWSVNWTSATT